MTYLSTHSTCINKIKIVIHAHKVKLRGGKEGGGVSVKTMERYNIIYDIDICPLFKSLSIFQKQLVMCREISTNTFHPKYIIRVSVQISILKLIKNEFCEIMMLIKESRKCT